MARSEWLVRNPGIPAAEQSLATVCSNVLCPIGLAENHVSVVGFLSGKHSLVDLGVGATGIA